MSHGIYAVENEKVNCPAGAREAALGHTQLARTTLMRGRLGTSAPTSSSPAPYPSLPPERRKLAHFAASPLPNKAFGFAGGPIGFVAHTMQGPGGTGGGPL